MDALSPLARVLYVEDNPVNARLMSQVLSRFRPDLSLAIAPDGESGLQLLDQLAPALVLLDYHLPDTNGLAMLKAIRATGNPIAVIVVTADARPELASAVEAAGGDALLTKPFEFAAVLDAIERQLPRAASGE